MKPLIPSLLFSIASAMLLGTGCIAIDVGRPDVFRHSESCVETSVSPRRTEAVAVSAKYRQDGDSLAVALHVDAEQEYDKLSIEEVVTVTAQKRIAIGLFPGAAEYYLVPKGSLEAVTDRRNGTSNTPARHAVHSPGLANRTGYPLAMFLTFGAYPVVGTLHSLLWDPFFGSWKCGHEWFDPDCVQTGKLLNGAPYRDSGLSPKILALRKFKESERKEIGVKTCYDEPNGIVGDNHTAAHFGLIGTHKYRIVNIDGPIRNPAFAIGTEKKNVSGEVFGPFIAKLSIPAIGYTDMRRIPDTSCEALFPLPMAKSAGTYEAEVSFLADTASAQTGLGAILGASLAKAGGKTWIVPVALHGASNRQVPGASHPDGIVEDAARDVGSHAATVRKTPAWDIETVCPYADGRAEWRVTILDGKLEAFDVLREARPHVERALREAFCANNPGVDERTVRTHVASDFGTNRTLRLTGVAFSVVPVVDGWRYDPDTRRGWVRLRISGSMPAEDAKRWARNNISAIVSEKNLALEAGKAPPAGATYNSCGEAFEDGVLTVEFEAVQ